VLGLAALAAGIAALVKFIEIRTDDAFGRTYLVLTLVTAASSLAIFRHGTFGPPHVLAILTLLALSAGYAAARSRAFGGASRHVQAICFTTTILFHLIPGVTETSIRLPVGHPFAESPESPVLRPIYLGLLAAWAIGLVLQIRWLRGRTAVGSVPAT
jgi:uncharacterized membrane protein